MSEGPQENNRMLPPLLGTSAPPPDLDQTQRQILQREGDEPKEGSERAPWWVWGISIAVLFSMGFYLGRYGGSFSTEAHDLYQRSEMGKQVEAPPPQGDLLYSAICVPCHQAGGVGLAGKYPPLAGSEWVAGAPGIPVRIVLNGLEGPIEVMGQTIVNEMPPLGAQLNDAEIAAVLTFVRSSWGNNASPVEPELVQKLRAETAGQGLWTAARLQALPVDETPQEATAAQ